MSLSIRSLTLVAALGAAPLLSFAQTDGQTVVMEFNCADRYSLSAYERQVVARQEESPNALRWYLYITRGRTTMSYEEGVRLADRVHARQRACARLALEAPVVEAAK